MNFQVAAGDVHAFLGGNGTGKSALLKIVAGIAERDGGDLLYHGQSTDDPAGRADRDRGLAVVHQELAIILASPRAVTRSKSSPIAAFGYGRK